MKRKYSVRVIAVALALMFALSACGGGQQDADVEIVPKSETLSVEQTKRMDDGRAESRDASETESEEVSNTESESNGYTHCKVCFK